MKDFAGLLLTSFVASIKGEEIVTTIIRAPNIGTIDPTEIFRPKKSALNTFSNENTNTDRLRGISPNATKEELILFAKGILNMYGENHD